jgi:hypothetical protein
MMLDGDVEDNGINATGKRGEVNPAQPSRLLVSASRRNELLRGLSRCVELES